MINDYFRKTVTIGIPAHNEKRNIAKLLESILKQKGNNFTIDKIIVVCDGCTDNTARIAGECSGKYKNIQVIDDHQRLGQAKRLNQLYKLNKSDIFITFDADVTLGTKYVVSELVKFFNDSQVGLVGGRVYPVRQQKFIGKALEIQEYFWSKVIDSINNGENLHSHTGPVSAASKKFLQLLKRPDNIIANDHFLYFSAIKNNFKYRSANKAYVYIKVPATFGDYMKQSTRFISSAKDIKEYFGEWVNQYYYVPRSNKIRAYWLTFIKDPFYLIMALILATLQRLLAFKYTEKNRNGLWTAVQSSK